MASNAETVSIWWRHHVLGILLLNVSRLAGLNGSCYASLIRQCATIWNLGVVYIWALNVISYSLRISWYEPSNIENNDRLFCVVLVASDYTQRNSLVVEKYIKYNRTIGCKMIDWAKSLTVFGETVTDFRQDVLSIAGRCFMHLQTDPNDWSVTLVIIHSKLIRPSTIWILINCTKPEYRLYALSNTMGQITKHTEMCI